MPGYLAALNLKCQSSMATAPYQYPIFNPSNVATSTGKVSTAGIPNFNALSSGAGNLIQSLMGGMPSASPARKANAYFGVGSGMPNSDFVRNRGFDLYGQQADAYQQQGFDNFLKLLQGYSGTVMPTAGQQIQNQQFNADMDFRNRQAAADEEVNRRNYDLKRPKALENSYAEYSPMGIRTKYIRYAPTYV